MKKYLMIAIPIVVAILIGSCESSIGRLPVIVPEDAPELTDLSGVIDNVSVIPFTDSLGHAIPPISKLIALPSGCFIAMDSRKNVYIYSSSGMRQTRVGRNGRGPGEYVALQDIAFNESSNTIFFLCLNKVIEYDTLGKYLASYKIPKYNYDAIAPCDLGFCLFVAAPNHAIEDLKTAHKTVHFFSKEKGEIIKTTIPRKDYILNTEMISYSAGNGYYLRPLEGENILYKIGDGRTEKIAAVSSGKKQAPNKALLRNGEYDISNYIMSASYKMPMNFQFANDKFVFSAIGPGGVLSYYLFDNNYSPIGRWREPDDCLSPVKIVSSDSESFYFLINDPLYWRGLDFEKADPLMKYIIANSSMQGDNPLIFKIRFK
ncbi:MAG: 6-bladed beta-propeller [Bacteroidales bacterium]|nr:6-bladed beta-propeller [Bacteroidales bacterium]